LPLDLQAERVTSGQLQTISISIYREADYGLAISQLVFNSVYGFAVLDANDNVIYTDNTTETSFNDNTLVPETTGVLSKTYNIPAGSIPQNVESLVIAYSVISQQTFITIPVIWHNATARLQFETAIIDTANQDVKLALGLGIALGVSGVVGLGIMTVFVVRMKKREKKLKKENASNKTVEMDGVKKAMDKKDPDVENGKQKYTSISTDKSTSPNTTTGGSGGSGNYNELPSLNPINESSPDLAKPSNLNDRFNIPYKEITFKREIGAGGFGKVFMGEWQSTEVAIKVSNTISAYDEFKKEAELMVNIRPHPNVLQVLGVSTDGPSPAIIMEYCPGGSLDLLLFDKSKPMTPDYQFRLILGIARGMLHLHKNNIVHRDLAARNILLSRDGEPKISDFGMSRIIESTMKEGTTKTNIGPIRWMAPESLKNKKYSTKSDVWTFGIVLSEILNREEPHKGTVDVIEVAVQIRTNFLTPQIPDDVPSVVSDIMKECWAPIPEDRPEMEQICEKLLQYKEQNNM
jgi:predicted Ser/Thr protein kinase